MVKNSWVHLNMPNKELDRPVFGTLPLKENKQEGLMEMEKSRINYIRVRYLRHIKK